MLHPPPPKLSLKIVRFSGRDEVYESAEASRVFWIIANRNFSEVFGIARMFPKYAGKAIRIIVREIVSWNVFLKILSSMD